MIKYCIFDLDGTLLNTITTITYYVNSVFEGRGIEPITEEECKIFIGDGARMLIKRALLSKGAYSEDSFEGILREYNETYNSAPLYLTEPYPGIRELIDALLLTGVKLGVVSNKPDDTTVSVVKEIFGGSFTVIRGGRAGVPLKPDPTAPLEVLREMGANDTSELAFIGDTAVDIITAKNMNASISVGVLWGFRSREELVDAGADVVVSTAEELLEVLRA